jgi:hypothetical protein
MDAATCVDEKLRVEVYLDPTPWEDKSRVRWHSWKFKHRWRRRHVRNVPASSFPSNGRWRAKASGAAVGREVSKQLHDLEKA